MIRGTTAALAVLVLVTASYAGATAKPELAYAKEVTALYSIDYWGHRPRNNADILPYHREFQKIIRSCRIGRENLTNTVIRLADKASELGARWVSNLRMMKAITRRITWPKMASVAVCSHTFAVAEAFMESGGP